MKKSEDFLGVLRWWVASKKIETFIYWLEESIVSKVEFIRDLEEDESSEDMALIGEDLQGQIWQFVQLCDETSSMFGVSWRTYNLSIVL